MEEMEQPIGGPAAAAAVTMVAVAAIMAAAVAVLPIRTLRLQLLSRIPVAIIPPGRTRYL